MQLQLLFVVMYTNKLCLKMSAVKLPDMETKESYLSDEDD